MTTDNYITEVANELLADYKTALAPYKASGNLLNSLSVSIVENETNYEFRIEGPEYGIYLENGTRPHFPPVEAILQWVRIKPILPRPLANGKLPSEKSLAFLIARKISRVGTEGTHTLSDTIDTKNYVERLALAVAKEITKEFDEDGIAKLFAPKTKRK